MPLYFKNKTAGFTLIELLVTIAIMMVIISIVVLGQGNYTDGISLANQSDSIALSISEAQVSSVSVKEFSVGSNNFSSAYGVSFNITPGGSKVAYVSFGDLNNNQVYDSGWNCPTGNGSECLRVNNIGGSTSIDTICELPVSGSPSCNVGRVDISFLRPNTDARIVYFDSVGNPMNFPNPLGVKINLVSAKGDRRAVTVSNSGQVSVQ
jgi:type II secretory pathway pseudopilin PulG